MSAAVGDTDFTVELWMKTTPADRTGNAGCAGGQTIARSGALQLSVFNPLFDPYFIGVYDAWGIGITTTGEIWFEIDDGLSSVTAGVNTAVRGCTTFGDGRVQDGAWHHLALERVVSSGLATLYVDGRPAGTLAGPAGPFSIAPTERRFLSVGSFSIPGHSSFMGQVDELRLSSTLRYGGSFTRPGAAFSPDAHTRGLWHFDTTSQQSTADQSGPAVPDVSGYGATPLFVESVGVTAASSPFGS